jgi:serine/threonine protein kinase
VVTETVQPPQCIHHKVLTLGRKVDECKPLLTDYGLSKILTDPRGGAEQTVCGTPSYVAPEILQCLTSGGTYNAVDADAWSLGCNLYILLSGKVRCRLVRRACGVVH